MKIASDLTNLQRFWWKQFHNKALNDLDKGYLTPVLSGREQRTIVTFGSCETAEHKLSGDVRHTLIALCF